MDRVHMVHKNNSEKNLEKIQKYLELNHEDSSKSATLRHALKETAKRIK
jgi:hypothetical protein